MMMLLIRSCNQRCALAVQRQPARRVASLASSQRKAAYVRKRAQIKCQAPPSIASIPAEPSDPIGNAGAYIRAIGCSRRVYLKNTYLTAEEIEGLAYRVRVLSSNEFLNSVLISSTDDDDPEQTQGLDKEIDMYAGGDILDGYLFDPKPGHVLHAVGGYDPLALFKSGKHKDAAAVASLLDSVSDLALATLGHARKSKVPVITIPHGSVTDSGYALCLSTYMCATEQTHFRILNPSRGLTFDPVGFSYILPKLRQEFHQQSSSSYGKSCGYILALMGYEATPQDMMETGLASHYLENPMAIMGTLERTLSLLPPWNQQQCVKNPVVMEGDSQKNYYRNPEDVPDYNLPFRNVQVASTMQAFAEYKADGHAPYTYDTKDDECFPAAFDLEPLPWDVARESDLVNYAATFDEIFQQENTVEGLIEAFREIGERGTQDPEEQEGIDVAADFVRRLEAQAPLALRVTHKLLKLGQGPTETIQSCMEREKNAQMKLMTMPDFHNWGKAQLTGGKASKLMSWQHRSVADVTEDEVSEVIGLH
ncbi:expressed unknown protein [Seminavis robusta]|uniref:3-hydroxyisobutyryl-CoA hydrolase n=1 Tax=Seminavis robusta TaxID=568900 RepID=A0A9N8F1R0_9STRA|nr:expressed unknown protein [Seminavis robusta]|eukprot:Sro2318_g323040.2  (536) ;mRNA; r:3133-4740